jgi:hypothetical protein
MRLLRLNFSRFGIVKVVDDESSALRRFLAGAYAFGTVELMVKTIKEETKNMCNLQIHWPFTKSVNR